MGRELNSLSFVYIWHFLIETCKGNFEMRAWETTDCQSEERGSFQDITSLLPVLIVFWRGTWLKKYRALRDLPDLETCVSLKTSLIHNGF